jgi:hypothetical protein
VEGFQQQWSAAPSPAHVRRSLRYALRLRLRHRWRSLTSIGAASQIAHLCDDQVAELLMSRSEGMHPVVAISRRRKRAFVGEFETGEVACRILLKRNVEGVGVLLGLTVLLESGLPIERRACTRVRAIRMVCCTLSIAASFPAPCPDPRSCNCTCRARTGGCFWPPNPPKGTHRKSLGSGPIADLRSGSSPAAARRTAPAQSAPRMRPSHVPCMTTVSGSILHCEVELSSSRVTLRVSGALWRE